MLLLHPELVLPTPPPTGELNETECDKQTCECDKSVVMCLQKQIYRDQYRGYLNIYCQGPTPNCSVYDPPPEEAACGLGYLTAPASS